MSVLSLETSQDDIKHCSADLLLLARPSCQPPEGFPKGVRGRRIIQPTWGPNASVSRAQPFAISPSAIGYRQLWGKGEHDRAISGPKRQKRHNEGVCLYRAPLCVTSRVGSQLGLGLSSLVTTRVTVRTLPSLRAAVSTPFEGANCKMIHRGHCHQ